MAIQADGAAPLKGKKVIVADRHPHTSAALRDMVTSLGAASVVHVQSVAEVVRCVKARDVNLIICDYHLEDLRDGQQLLEELRQERLIPLSTIFMMITAERNYRKVAAVAEFTPDDYLIKPFTAGQLLDRLVRVSRKKDVFERAFLFMESGRPAAALPECRLIAASHPEYAADAYRLMADMLLDMKRLPEAEALIKSVLVRKAVPWAFMGLANVRHAEGRLGEAEAILEKLAADHPEYLGAQDFLARVKAELDRPAEALRILEAAGAISSANVVRLRRTAELAATTGDHDKSARLYSRVLDRSRNSAMARPEDTLALSEALVAQGKHADAEKVAAEHRRSMKDQPEGELVAHLLDYRRHARQADEGSQDQARASIEAAIAARQGLKGGLSVSLDFELFDACLASGRDDAAVPLGRDLLARADLSPKVRSRIETALASRPGVVPRKAAIVPLDQVLAMLGKLSATGWNDALGAACDASINHWSEKDPEAAALKQARLRMDEVLRKYGMGARTHERVSA